MILPISDYALIMSVNKENIYAKIAKQKALQNLNQNKNKRSLSEWVKKIKEGDIQVLAQAISLAESTLTEDIILAKKIISTTANNASIRIGITGIPGVGKSTFINILAQSLQTDGNKIAVLAIDPSSEHSGGSILGDKTRMTDLAALNNIFIRPTPTGNYMGGLHPAALDTVKLCEAAGYNIILIETVGVGQSEHHIAHLADLNLLLLAPNTGDELQGIKSGIVEQADVLIIHKADKAYLKQAKVTMAHYTKALNLRTNMLHLPIFFASSVENTGFIEIRNYILHAKDLPTTYSKREYHELFWGKLQLDNQILKFCHKSPNYNKWIAENIQSGNFESFFNIQHLLLQL